MTRPFHALILAAGSGQRFGSDTPKQYCYVAGKSVLGHALDVFLSHPRLGSLRVIADPNHVHWYQKCVSHDDIPAPITGGETRKESVFNGLKSLSNLNDDDLIVIHDGARPLVSHDHINAVLQALEIHTAASLALPTSDTLLRDNGDYVDRTNLNRLQTPQAFHYGTILEAHEKGANLNVTDDTALVKALGIEVVLVRGSSGNIKITHQDDLTMAEALLSQSYRTQTGSGFDVHRLEENDARSLMLCGVEIPSPLSLVGHSDADVGLHALTDALLGAIGVGDIGDHFPPSDDAYKDMDSAIFLQKTLGMLDERGAVIQNIDFTLICEAPKIGPHKEAMKSRVAQLCNLHDTQVNIKATTTEGLGFTGRGEGIAAQAAVSVKVPV